MGRSSVGRLSGAVRWLKGLSYIIEGAYFGRFERERYIDSEEVGYLVGLILKKRFEVCDDS